MITDKTYKESGFIAQEIYYDIPELKHIVSLNDDVNPDPNIKINYDKNLNNDPDYSSWGDQPAGVNYIQLIPYVTSAIQELSKRNDKKTKKIQKINKENKEIKKENKEIKKENKEIKKQNKLIMKQLKEMNNKLKYCLDKIQ